MIWYSTDGIVYAAIFQQLNHNNDYLCQKGLRKDEGWGGARVLYG